jgi:hypothetical protein
MTRNLSITIILIFVSQALFAQIINIEGRRMQTDSLRFVLNNDLYISFDSIDDDELYQISNDLSTQFKSKDLKKIYFIIGNYNLIHSAGSDLRNSWLLHLRFNYKLSPLFRIEAFAQSQYNEFSNINRRNLVGAGLRFKLISKEKAALYIGNSYMYENEKILAINTKFYHHRNNTYASFNATVSKSNIEILNTVYYQPLYEDFSNYRVLNQFKIEVPISEKFSINTILNYTYLSKTDLYEKQSTTNLSIGLGLNL